MTITQTHRSLSISTSLGKDQVILTHLSGDEAMSALYAFELRVLTKTGIDPHALHWTSACAQIQDAGVPTRFFQGLITHVQYCDIDDDGYCETVLTLSPSIYALQYRENHRIFKGLSIPDIASLLCKEHGVTSPVPDRLTQSYPALDYVVQYNETDLDFISRLFEKVGIFYRFKMDASSNTLVLYDDSTTLPKLSKAIHLLGLQQKPGDWSSREQRLIYDWEDEASRSIANVQVVGYNADQPDTPIKSTAQSDKQAAKTANTHYTYPGHIAEGDDATRWAQNKSQELAFRANIHAAKSDQEALSAGMRFDLLHGDDDSLNDEYYITCIHHNAFDLSHQVHEKTSGSSQSYQNSFTCVSKAFKYSPEKVTEIPTINGFHTAFVTTQNNAPVQSDEKGQVSAHYYWDDLNDVNEASTNPIPVMQSTTGDGFGSQHIPRQGHEVMVQYVNGDLDQPVIAGSLYNEDNKTPRALPDNQNLTTLSSQTLNATGLGNEVSMDDTPDNEALNINAKKDLEHIVGNNQTTEVLQNHTTNISQGDHVTKVSNTATHFSKQKISLCAGSTEFHINPNCIEMKGKLVNINPKHSLNVNIPGLGNQDKAANEEVVSFVDVVYSTADQALIFLTQDDVNDFKAAEKPFQDAAIKMQQAQVKASKAKLDQDHKLPQGIQDELDQARVGMHKVLIGLTGDGKLGEIVKLSAQINGKGWSYLPQALIEKTKLASRIDVDDDNNYIYKAHKDYANRGSQKETLATKRTSKKGEPKKGLTHHSKKSKLSVSEAVKGLKANDPKSLNSFDMSVGACDKSLFKFTQALEKAASVHNVSVANKHVALRTDADTRVLRYTALASISENTYDAKTHTYYLAKAGTGASLDLLSSTLNLKATLPGGIEGFHLKDTLGDDFNPLDFGYFKFDLNLKLYGGAGASVLASGDIHMGGNPHYKADNEMLDVKDKIKDSAHSSNNARGHISKAVYDKLKKAAEQAAKSAKATLKQAGGGVDAECGAFVGIEAGCFIDGAVCWANPEEVTSEQTPKKISDNKSGAKRGIPKWKELADLGVGVLGIAGGAAELCAKVSYYDGQFVVHFTLKAALEVGMGGNMQIVIDKSHIVEFTKFIYHTLKDFNFSEKQRNLLFNGNCYDRLNFILIAAIWEGVHLSEYANYGFQRAKDWFSKKVEAIFDNKAMCKKILELSENINKNSTMLLHMPPVTKGRLLYKLSTYFNLFGKQSQEPCRAMQAIIISAQSQTELIQIFQNIMEPSLENMGKTINALVGQKIILENIQIEGIETIIKKEKIEINQEDYLVLSSRQTYIECENQLTMKSQNQADSSGLAALQNVLEKMHLVSYDCRAIAMKRQKIKIFNSDDNDMHNMFAQSTEFMDNLNHPSAIGILP
jgi:type VI secretion system secreted protein VgrG